MRDPFPGHATRGENYERVGPPPGVRQAGGRDRSAPPLGPVSDTGVPGPANGYPELAARAEPVRDQRSGVPAAARSAAGARWLTARTVDGTYNDLSAPPMGAAGTRFGRNVPLRRTRRERGERLMTPNPCVVSTALLARGPQIPLTDLVLRMAHDPAPGRRAILS